MEAVAHNPSFARMVKVPQSVGQHYAMADKRDHYGSGHLHDFAKSIKKGEGRLRKRQTLKVGKGVGDNMSNIFRVY